jgi:hypothetical protein
MHVVSASSGSAPKNDNTIGWAIGFSSECRIGVGGQQVMSTERMESMLAQEMEAIDAT